MTIAGLCLEKGFISSFEYLDSSSIMSKLVGNSERRLQTAFRRSTGAGPTLLILDQIDCLAKKRSLGEAGDLMDRLLSTLLTEMDGITTESSVIVIGTTRYKDALDPAILRPGRFDYHVELGGLDFKGRSEVLERLTEGSGVNCMECFPDEFIEKCNGFSAADLEGLWREALMICLRENINHSPKELRQEHVLASFKLIESLKSRI